MSREVSNSEHKVIEHQDDLLEVFIQGARPKTAYKIGIEFERFVLDADTGVCLPYDGQTKCIKKLLEAFEQKTRWTPVYDKGNLISLTNQGSAITLEPGGQLEISASAHTGIHESCVELLFLIDVFDKIGQEQGLFYARTGVPPVTTLDTAQWVPKSRYETMRSFHQSDQAFLEMMTVSASVQINFDYSSEQDCAQKMLVSSKISPILGALYANSFYEDKKINGYQSRRLQIWDDLNQARSGIKDFFVDGSFSYEKYRDYMLDVPMYFVSRDGAYKDVEHQTFRSYLQNKPYGDVLEEDWLLHLTTTFPEVRLKDHLEFRTIDSNPFPHVISSAAFIKGLMHNASNLNDVEGMLSHIDITEVQSAFRRAAKEGLRTSYGGKPLHEYAKELYQLALNGLAETETKFLKQVQSNIQTQSSPADLLLAELNFEDPDIWKQL